MVMSFIMFLLMQALPGGEALYKEPFTRSLDASYQGSELKNMVDSGALVIKSKYPALVTIGTISYSLGVQRKIQFGSEKYSPITGSKFSLLVNKELVYTSFRWEL